MPHARRLVTILILCGAVTSCHGSQLSAAENQAVAHLIVESLAPKIRTTVTDSLKGVSVIVGSHRGVSARYSSIDSASALFDAIVDVSKDKFPIASASSAPQCFAVAFSYADIFPKRVRVGGSITRCSPPTRWRNYSSEKFTLALEKVDGAWIISEPQFSAISHGNCSPGEKRPAR